MGRRPQTVPAGLVHGARKPADGDVAASGVIDDAISAARPLARLGIGLHRCHRQTQGDDIDVDAAVEARVEVLAGSAPDEAVYSTVCGAAAILSVLVLLDVSGSSAEPGSLGQTVHNNSGLPPRR